MKKIDNKLKLSTGITSQVQVLCSILIFWQNLKMTCPLFVRRYAYGMLLYTEDDCSNICHVAICWTWRYLQWDDLISIPSLSSWHRNTIQLNSSHVPSFKPKTVILLCYAYTYTKQFNYITTYEPCLKLYIEFGRARKNIIYSNLTDNY